MIELQCPHCLNVQPNGIGMPMGTLEEASRAASFFPATFIAVEVPCINRDCARTFPALTHKAFEEARLWALSPPERAP